MNEKQLLGGKSMSAIQFDGSVWIQEKDVRCAVNAALATNEERNATIARLERELSRYKRLEAILRDRADASMEPGDERYRGNAEMRVLTDWENGE